MLNPLRPKSSLASVTAITHNLRRDWGRSALNDETPDNHWRQCFGPGIKDATVQRLSSASDEIAAAAGTCIVDQEDETRHVILIVSGILKAVRFSRNGHAIWLSDFRPGDLAGEMSILTEKRRTSSLVAGTDSQLLTVSGSVFSNLLDDDAGLARATAAMLATRLATTSNQLASLMVTPVVGRLYAELIDLGKPVPGDDELFQLDSQFSVVVLSERIHASREATSRALTTLEHRGLAVRSLRGIDVVLPTDFRIN